MTALDEIKRHIRSVPDWPAAGVMFRDITPLLADPALFHLTIEQFAQRYRAQRPQAVAGLDARGFIVGAALAYALGTGFVPIRKQGKLPFTTLAETYALEYGNATVEVHTDAVRPGERVVLIDDLVATGGTLIAGQRLLERLGAQVIEAAAIVELPALGGAQKVRDSGLPLFTLVSF